MKHSRNFASYMISYDSNDFTDTTTREIILIDHILYYVMEGIVYYNDIPQNTCLERFVKLSFNIKLLRLHRVATIIY